MPRVGGCAAGILRSFPIKGPSGDHHARIHPATAHHSPGLVRHFCHVREVSQVGQGRRVSRKAHVARSCFVTLYGRLQRRGVHPPPPGDRRESGSRAASAATSHEGSITVRSGQDQADSQHAGRHLRAGSRSNCRTRDGQTITGRRKRRSPADAARLSSIEWASRHGHGARQRRSDACRPWPSVGSGAAPGHGASPRPRLLARASA